MELQSAYNIIINNTYTSKVREGRCGFINFLKRFLIFDHQMYKELQNMF